MKKVLILVTLALLTSGCLQPSKWTLTDDMNSVVKSSSFQITVPQKWVRLTQPESMEYVEIDGENQYLMLEAMTVTRDGVDLQLINVIRRYPDNAFPAIKKKSRASMLPPEVADLYVTELRKRSGLERLKVLTNKPAKVGGKDGFRLVMQYKNDEGLRIRIVSYGFVDKTGFYTISYRAPYLYYYERDYKKFTQLVKSFRQLKGAFEPLPETPAWLKIFT